MHSGVKAYRGNPAAARTYVEADHARVDDYYLVEGTGLAMRFVATPDGVEAVGALDGDGYEWSGWRVFCVDGGVGNRNRIRYAPYLTKSAGVQQNSRVARMPLSIEAHHDSTDAAASAGPISISPWWLSKFSHWGSLGGSANIDGVGNLPVGPNRLNKSRASASMRPSVPGAHRS